MDFIKSGKTTFSIVTDLENPAAKYAADSLLPVVGGDIADAMDGIAASASLVRSTAGVTGVIAMLAVCLRPVISMAAMMLALRLSAALTEPAADGPLKKCMDQLGQAMGLMLAAVAVLLITIREPKLADADHHPGAEAGGGKPRAGSRASGVESGIRRRQRQGSAAQKC